MSPAERLAAAEGILVDLDGTLIFGQTPAPWATDLVADWGERLAVVSNYSTATALATSHHLARLGLAIPPERLFLAGERAIRRLAARRPGARVFFLMTAPMVTLAETLGLVPAEEDVEVVLLGRDLAFSYDRLALATLALHAGAALHVTNLDRLHPGEGHRPVPETGALLAALRAACPGIRPVVEGKPRPGLFRDALKRLGLSARQAVMIGDNPEADTAGAQAAGMAALLVGPRPRPTLSTSPGSAFPALQRS